MENPTEKQKVVINCWKQKGAHPGLGDIIMGTLCIYQICKKYGYTYVVDTHLHPISNFLKHNRTEYSDWIDEMGGEDKVNWIGHHRGLEYHIVNSQDDIYLVHSNEFYNMPLSDEEKQFILSILEPNDELQELIDEFKNHLPKNYNIMHFRMGDDIMIYNNINRDLNYYEKLAVKNFRLETDIIFSDAYIFKKILNEKYNFIISPIEPIHIGVETDLEKIKYTLVEFFILSFSKKIKYSNSYSPNQPSGFIKNIAHFYNIPLESIDE